MARCGIISFPKTFLSQSRILKGFQRVISFRASREFATSKVQKFDPLFGQFYEMDKVVQKYP